MKDKTPPAHDIQKESYPQFDLIMELQRLNSIRNAKFALELYEEAIKTAERIIKLAEDVGLLTYVNEQKNFIYKIQIIHGREKTL
ncbi:MAG: hypothetical protein ACTSR8_08470 [Promethearchaeota archaeon]